MARIVSALFNEDIDLSAAIGDITPAPSQLAGLSIVPGTDRLKFPNIEGMSIVGIREICETVGGAGMGYLTLHGLNGDRTFQFGENLVIGDHVYTEDLFPPGQFPIPPNQEMTATSSDSGAGAEQHSVIIDFIHPGLEDIPTIGNGICTLGINKVALTTDVRVANTIGPGNNVLGDGVAYQDGQIVYPTTTKSLYALLKIGNYPGLAGVGVCGLLAPDKKSHRFWPQLTAMSVMGKDFEVGWLFSGDAQPMLTAAGLVVTTAQYELTIGHIN